MNTLSVYQTLYQHYGPQHWWPGETPFEVMVGAILTQNTAWTNVEKAMANLKATDSLYPITISEMPHDELAAMIRPAGYFNVKANRLRNFCIWFLGQGGESVLKKCETTVLRHGLLSVNGVGPETADDMMLYGFERAVFVIDAYTRRLFSRLGMIRGDEGYEGLRHHFEKSLSSEVNDTKKRVMLYNEYHALIVIHAKDTCRKRPLCNQCCLNNMCPASEAKKD